MGERDNASNNIARRQRFYNLITKYDINSSEREEIKDKETLRLGMARQLCQESYGANHYKRTLPDDHLRAIMEGGSVALALAWTLRVRTSPWHLGD